MGHKKLLLPNVENLSLDEQFAILQHNSLILNSMKKTEDYLAESDTLKAMAPSRKQYNQHNPQPEELKITTTDPTVLSIIKQLNDRSAVGLKTYGVSLREDDTRDFGQWISEVQAELMDGVNYLEKVKELWGSGKL